MTPLGQPPCLCGASIPRRFADDNGDNISDGHDNLFKIAVFRARWRAGYVDICACAGCGRRIAESRSRSARSVCLVEGCHQEGHQQSCPGEGTPDINTPSLSYLLNIPILILITLPHPHPHPHPHPQPTPTNNQPPTTFPKPPPWSPSPPSSSASPPPPSPAPTPPSAATPTTTAAGSWPATVLPLPCSCPRASHQHLTGYTYDQLQAAANTTDGSKIYDALYSCDSETGDISYAGWCGGGGKCSTGVVPNDNCTP